MIVKTFKKCGLYLDPPVFSHGQVCSLIHFFIFFNFLASKDVNSYIIFHTVKSEGAWIFQKNINLEIEHIIL